MKLRLLQGTQRGPHKFAEHHFEAFGLDLSLVLARIWDHGASGETKCGF